MSQPQLRLTSVSASVSLFKSPLLLLDERVVFMSSNLVHVLHKQTEAHLGIVQVSDKDDGSCLAKLDGNHIIFGTCGGTVGIISLQTSQVVASFKVASEASIISVAFVAGEEGTPGFLLAGFEGKVRVLAVAPDLQLAEASSIDFGGNLVETIELCTFQSRKFAFISCCDSAVHIYSLEKEGTLAYLNSLLGHTNKVKSIAIESRGSGLRVASASMDNYIRVWKSVAAHSSLANKNVFEFIPGFDIELESVLLGHTESVNGVRWCQGKLISASADCSVLVWEELEDSWVTTSRFGQLYGNKNAFLGVEATPDGSEIYAHTVTGALLAWRHKDTSPKVSIFADPTSQQKMQSECLISGHFKRVTGLSWGSSGTYLASCAQDQTTRIFCKSRGRWVEIARAQIHGYDLNTIKMLPGKKGCPDMLVCGGDEKVVRLLEPLAHFCNFHNIFSGQTLEHSSERAREFTACQSPLIYQVGSESSQEVLGLMTKASERTNFYVDAEEEGEEAKDTQKQFKQVDYVANFLALGQQLPKGGDGKASSLVVDRIGHPTEDILVSTTLWPEVNKLYGHGYEISAVATNKDGSVLVSASKSLTKENAALIFWDLKNFKVDYSVAQHASTVLDAQFTGDKLLTTGRDRVVCLWEKDVSGRYQPKYHKSAHAKIVYGLAVGFGESMHLFATASRDHSVKLWALGGLGFEEKDVLNVGEEAHSIQFVQETLICVGLLSGRLVLVRVDPVVGKLTLLPPLPAWFNHGRCVNRIARNPVNNGEFATCGDDHTVRFFELNNK